MMKKDLFKAISKSIMVALFATLIMVIPKSTEAAAYTYTNDTYGFSIDCPDKPVGVIDLARQPGGNKGVMLVFENDGMEVNCGWIIMVDAFQDENMPDLAKLTKEEVNEVLKQMVVSDNGIAALVSVDGQPAVYTVAQTEDMAKTYIRAKNGKKYVVALTANKNIFRDRINPYQQGLISFKTK